MSETTEVVVDDRKAIRSIVRGAYDLQKLRIQTGNRVVANFRSKLGHTPGVKAETVLDAEAQQLLKDLKKSHSRITDAILDRPRYKVFPGDELISTFTDFALVSSYIDLEGTEKEQFKRLEKALEEIPIYTTFLKKVKGIGPAMAGVIVSEIDIEKAMYPSSLWAYAGLDLGPDGLGRSRRREHLVKRKYIDKNGKEAERDSITYNPFLKTKLMGVLAPSFLRSASEYRQYYDQYRHRIESDPNRECIDKPSGERGNIWSPLRRHNASSRYMVKRFLVDLYAAWRPLEGLEVSEEYSEAKHGHKHSGPRGKRAA